MNWRIQNDNIRISNRDMRPKDVRPTRLWRMKKVKCFNKLKKLGICGWKIKNCMNKMRNYMTSTEN